ncbi:MAG: hypothetical protein WC379_01100 [Methanoregula sp.]|jgi:hypothetical protein
MHQRPVITKTIGRAFGKRYRISDKAHEPVSPVQLQNMLYVMAILVVKPLVMDG